MFWDTLKIKNLLMLSAVATQLTACNDAEFFQKEFLKDEYSSRTSSSSDCTVNCATASEGGSLTPGSGGTIDDGSSTNTGSTTGSTGGSPSTDGSTGSTGSTDGSTGSTTVTYQDMADNFTQNSSEQRPIDILWVMDNSGSMGDEQSSLAYNFDVFIQDFVTKDVDFQMAITTTDGRSAYEGAAVGDFNQLNSTAAQNDSSAFIDYFANKIHVGTSGSGTEKGLNGMKKFLEGDGLNWLRSDAFLVVVVVSDEEDQSSGTVASYIDFLKSTKTNDGLINVNSIVTFEDEAFGDPSRGQRYMDVSNATGGVIANIQNNFYDILSNMGGKILDLISSFPLSGTPANGTLEVYVDGVKETTGWEYDATKNTVKFLQGYVPTENSNVEIRYKVEVK